MMRRCLPLWLLTLTMTMMLSLTAAPRAMADAEAALRLLPANTDAAVIVPSLSSLNRQVADLRQALNLPYDDMDNVVGLFQQQLGMRNGMNDAGPMVLALFDLAPAVEGGSRPGIAMLVPVSNYNAFVGNFDGNPRDDIAVLTMAGGQTAFARQLDNFAVLSDRRELAENYRPHNDATLIRAHAGRVGSKYLDQATVAFYVNLDAVGPALLNMLEQAADFLGDDMAMMTEFGLDDATLQASRAMQQLYGDAGRAMIEGVQSMVIALDLTDQGLGMTQTFQIRDGSPLHDIFPGEPSSAARELAHLPDRPFLFASAFDDAPVRFNHLLRQLLDVVPEEQLAMLGVAQESIDLLEQTQAYASVFYVPNQAAMMTGGFLNMLSTYRVEDPDAYLAAWRSTIEKMDEQEFELPEAPNGAAAGAGAGGGTLRMSGSYVDDALQIDGVQIAQYQIQFQMPAEVMQQLDNPFAAGMGAMSYGGYIAGKGNHVVMTTTTDPQIMRAALRALDQPTGLGSRGSIAAIRDHAMPPNAAAESYVSVQGVAQLANLALMVFGGDPINVPDDVPPIAMGFGVQDDGIAMRLFLPTGAMHAVGDVVGQVAPMFGGTAPMMPGQQPRNRRPPY